MIVLKIGFFLTCVFFTLCESFSVESLSKCRLKDNECLRNLYEHMVRDIAKTGIPELGIPKVDPIILKNVSVSVLGLLNLTMVDGVAKGIRNCVFNDFQIEIEKDKGSQKITCDLTIKGHYTVVGDGELITQIFGDGGIHGDGNGKVELEKIKMSFNFPFFPVRKDDGEIYMKCLYDDIVYDYDIKGRARFAADNIFLGKQDISEFVVSYLNQNGIFLLRSMGRPFIDKAMEFYFGFAKKFFEGVPARYYILDNLEPYLKK